MVSLASTEAQELFFLIFMKYYRVYLLGIGNMLVTAADTLQIRHIVDATVLQLQLNQSYIICYSSIYT